MRFIRVLKQTNPKVQITLFSDRRLDQMQGELPEYIEEFIRWKQYYFIPSRWSKMMFLNKWINCVSLYFQFKKLSKEKRYDIVNIHYPQYFISSVMRYMKRMATAVVVSPWGSDVLRIEGKKKRNKLAGVFHKADFITANPSGNVGKVLVEDMRIDPKKLRPMGWGSETIDFINEHVFDSTAEEAKRKLGLGGRYVITCGYNAFEEQRHEVMINAIAAVKHQLPDNLTLLFPVTYGYSYGNRKQEYVEQIKCWCKDLDLDAVFYEDYLSVADLFLLRQGTDMFIHIQTTDAGNSSLQEYVLCGKKVVHGTWIHYPYLEQYEPLFYFPVNDLEQLGEAILNAYQSDHIEVPTQVLDYIRNRGWKAKMKLWNEFFASIS